MDDKQKLYVFSDYVCPWCYLGQSRLKKVLKKINLKTELIHFPLHPDTPINGMELTKLFNCTKKDLISKNIYMEKLFYKASTMSRKINSNNQMQVIINIFSQEWS